MDLNNFVLEQNCVYCCTLWGRNCTVLFSRNY